MGTAFIISEDGVEKVHTNFDRDVCVTFDGVFYCQDPQHIRARFFHFRGEPRPIRTSQLELVTEFYDKLDEGDFVAVAKYWGSRGCLSFYVFANSILLSRGGSAWILTCNIRSILTGWNSYALKHAFENSIGRYISNGSMIAGSLVKGIRITRFKPPNAVINLVGLYGLERALNDIIAYRRKTKAPVIMWYRGNLSKFEYFDTMKIALKRITNEPNMKTTKTDPS